MKLRDILRNTGVKTPTGADDLEITGIVSDSRKAREGCLFVALPGTRAQGNEFVNSAVENGAAVVAGSSISSPGQTVAIDVKDPVGFLASCLDRYYGSPARRMRVAGVTGTNGKTTVTYLLEALLDDCGVIGTVNHRYGPLVKKAGNTTPGLVENFELLNEMVSSGAKYCAMEVSSHALDQRRVEGIDFAYGIFTNLTSDHLDYHHDRESYFLAKSKLFTGLSSAAWAIINKDDALGPRLIKMSKAPVWTYGVREQADFMARDIRFGFEGTQFHLITPAGEGLVKTSLIGRHNVENILAAAAVCVGESMSLRRLSERIEAFHAVPGRLERIEEGQDFYVFIDYAHTEDALENVLSSIRAVKEARVHVVFGCGGDRDRSKRPRMAAVVERLADFATVTNDNPRTEDPEAIVADILQGFRKKNFEVNLDREAAIRGSLFKAGPGDVVLIAGKGHEDYQIFKDRTVSFDERAIVKKYLKELSHGKV